MLNIHNVNVDSVALNIQNVNVDSLALYVNAGAGDLENESGV